MILVPLLLWSSHTWMYVLPCNWHLILVPVVRSWAFRVAPQQFSTLLLPLLLPAAPLRSHQIRQFQLQLQLHFRRSHCPLALVCDAAAAVAAAAAHSLCLYISVSPCMYVYWSAPLCACACVCVCVVIVMCACVASVCGAARSTDVYVCMSLCLARCVRRSTCLCHEQQQQACLGIAGPPPQMCRACPGSKVCTMHVVARAPCVPY